MVSLDAPAEMHNREELRIQLQDIARSEIRRHRNRLASLTTEQQLAVEALLLSTADLISHEVIVRVQSYPEAVQLNCVRVWASAFAA